MSSKPQRAIKSIEPASALIIDPKTGLQWSPTLGERVDWAKAKAVAEAYRGGDHDDWRLPTIEELITLIDFSRFNPATNIGLFPDTKPNFYWSSTPDASSPSYFAWLVGFNDGTVLFNGQYHSAFVRAVRGSRAGQ